MGKLSVVVGGQFGSESKGAVTAWLSRRSTAQDVPVTVVRVAGPNAGHTAYDDDGNRWALRQVPVAVVDPQAELIIGAGSEIDPSVLMGEVERLEAAGIKVRDRLRVDDQATVIDPEYYTVEADAHLTARVGSTGKGVGAARSARVMRRARTAAESTTLTSELLVVPDTADMLIERLGTGHHVIVEGTQGYGLGLHAGHYPKCTSSDCRAVDFLSMAGLDPAWADDYECWVVVRTYPIRVAGNSGALADETSWEELGLEPEFTTVTKKMRRVGHWDPVLVERAVRANGGRSVVKIALAMADYVVPQVAGVEGDAVHAAGRMGDDTFNSLSELITRVETDCDADVFYVGTGPQTAIEWE